MPSHLSKAVLAGLLAKTVAADLMVAGGHVKVDVKINTHVKEILQDQGCGCQEEVTMTIPYFGPTQTATYIDGCDGHRTHYIQIPIPTGCGHSTPPPALPTSSTTPPPPPPPPATSTTATTSSQVPPPPPPANVPEDACPALNSCSERGFSVDYYSNPIGGDSPTNTVPWYYYLHENLRKLASSITQDTYFEQNYGPSGKFKKEKINGMEYYRGWTRDVNGITVDANNFTLVYSGFYQAPATGTFTLCATADNQNDLFFGRDTAFNCDTGKVDQNSIPTISSQGANYVNNAQCVDLVLTEGAYYPIRSVMKNWGGPSAFNMYIQRPRESKAQATHFFGDDALPISCGRWAN